MMTSSTYRSVAARFLLALLLLIFFGCAALSSGNKTLASKSVSDSSAHKSLPIDPWSLGPDVFGSTTSVDSSAQIAAPMLTDSTSAETSYTDSAQQTIQSSSVAEDEETVVPILESEPTASIEAAPELPDTIYTVQLGTFLDKERAQTFYDHASEVLGLAGKIFGDWPFYKLQFGAYPTRASADSLHRVAMSRGFYDARVLKLPSR